MHTYIACFLQSCEIEAVWVNVAYISMKNKDVVPIHHGKIFGLRNHFEECTVINDKEQNCEKDISKYHSYMQLKVDNYHE